MRIQKPPRLSQAFGRSSPGASCEPFSVTTTFPGDRSTLVAVVGDIDLATVAILVECAETALNNGGPLVGAAGFSCYRDRADAPAALG